MKKRRIFQVNPLILLIMVLTMAVSAQVTEQRFTFSIRTANIDSIFQQIILSAESKGGYFTTYNNHTLSLRVPVGQLQEIQKTIADLAEIVNKSFSSTDRTADLERYTLQIESRQKLMDKYLDLVKTAPFAELQSIERELVSLNAQIEGLQGGKLGIERRAAMVSITIHAGRISTSPEQRSFTRSPFTWINWTDLNSITGDF